MGNTADSRSVDESLGSSSLPSGIYHIRSRYRINVVSQGDSTRGKGQIYWG